VQSEPLRDRDNRAEAQGPKGPQLLNIAVSSFLWPAAQPSSPVTR